MKHGYRTDKRIFIVPPIILVGHALNICIGTIKVTNNIFLVCINRTNVVTVDFWANRVNRQQNPKYITVLKYQLHCVRACFIPMTALIYCVVIKKLFAGTTDLHLDGCVLVRNFKKQKNYHPILDGQYEKTSWINYSFK